MPDGAVSGQPGAIVEEDFDREVDLIVAGAGPAGMSAALVAALDGLDALICEKTSMVGGTAATAAGTLWIPGNRQSHGDDGTEDEAQAEAYMNSLIGDRADGKLRMTFLRTGCEAIDYLTERTDVQFVACGRHPDYQTNRPGAAVTGRAIVPRMFDGRLLGKDFERVRPPIREFMVFGGMMVGKDDIPHLVGRFSSLRNFSYAAGLFIRYLRDRLSYSRGTRVVMGNALVARLFYSLRKAQVPILFETGVVDLIKQGSAIVGAVIERDGRQERIRARRGVILATGGFAHNERFRRLFMPEPTPRHSLAAASDCGEGMMLGERYGGWIAAGEHPGGGFWTPVSVVPHADGTQGLYPHLSLDRAKPGLVAVNKSGRRFVNEADSYHDFVLGMFAANKVVPSIPAYLVCASSFVRRYGLGAIYPGTTNLMPFVKSGYLTMAPTLELLAEQIGIDAAGLVDTARRNDAYAESGLDPDFGKGDTELNRFNGDLTHSPNPCLGPLGPGPYCAMEVWPADIACSTGLTTDENACVLRADGTPVRGLYACGNDMASVMAGSYPGPGTTLGPAIVFGYRAAKHAVRNAG